MDKKKEGKKLGRPASYKPQYAQALIDFFNRPLTQITVDGKVQGCELPQLVQFAREIGHDYATLTRWRDEYEDFRKAYIEAKKIQESLLVGNSIQNRYNPYFAQFMLKNCHGWRDKSEEEASEPVKVTLSDHRGNQP